MSEGLEAGTLSGDDVTVINDENTLPTPDAAVEQGEDQGVVDQEFYNVHDGLKGRLKGRYLDEVEREEAEVLRAKLENREPDFENAPPTAGTPVVVKGQLIDNSVMSNPSSQGVDSEAQPIATVPVDLSPGDVDKDVTYTAQVAEEDNERGTATSVAGDPIQVDQGHEDSAQAVLDNYLAANDNTGATGDVQPDNADGSATPEGSTSQPNPDVEIA